MSVSFSMCTLFYLEMQMAEGQQYQMGKTKVRKIETREIWGKEFTHVSFSQIFIRQPVNLFTMEELRERKLHDIVWDIVNTYQVPEFACLSRRQ
jgi:hypothetical protein